MDLAARARGDGLKDDGDVTGIGMADGVVEGLLDDPVDMCRRLSRQRIQNAIRPERESDPSLQLAFVAGYQFLKADQ